MLVSMWMTRELTTVDPDASVASAARLMSKRQIRRLPVVEATAAGPRLLGIVSSTDLYRAFPADVNPFAAEVPDCAQTRVPVHHVMHRDAQTIAPDAPLEEAALVMRDRKIGALPVVRDGRLVGLITGSALFRAFGRVLGPADGVPRITCGVQEGVDAGGSRACWRRSATAIARAPCMRAAPACRPSSTTSGARAVACSRSSRRARRPARRPRDRGRRRPRGPRAQHSGTLTASPPCEVSL